MATFSTGSLKKTCRFVGSNFIYSSALSVTKSGQLLALESSRQCRRYLSSIGPYSVDRRFLSGASRRWPMQMSSASVCLCPSSAPFRLPFGNMQCLRFGTMTGSQNAIEGDVNIHYRHGLPVLTLTLPSRGERCEFSLRLVTETVGEFCDNVRKEDRGVDTIALYSKDGAKIASSTLIEHIMRSEFQIRLNDRLYVVKPPEHVSVTSEHIQQLNDVKALVASLHASLSADEQCLRTERDLVAKLETMRQELEPLEKKKLQLASEVEKRTNRVLWFGLGLMGVQFGAFARLTWFEYSWDIVEPITYFTTYATVISGYAYFVASRIQYEYPDAKQRIALNKFYKLCRRRGFDVDKYNHAKESLHVLEQDLEQLRRQPAFGSFRKLEQTMTIIRDMKTGYRAEPDTKPDKSG